MTAETRVLLEKDRLRLTIDRLCHELIEEYGNFEECCLVGLQPRGIYMADRLRKRLTELGFELNYYGKLDVTFYRDDFKRRDTILVPSETEMDFIVENKRVLLVDDVLYTGRTIRAALTALQHYGRPSQIDLIVLVDRRFNRHLPINADFVGLTIDTLDEAHIRVEWEEMHGQDRVQLYPQKLKP